MTSRGRRASGWALVTYTTLAVALFHATWAHPGSRMAGFGGDSQQYAWALRWFPFAVLHGHNPLTSTYVGHGSGVNLAWNTSLSLPAALLSPVTLIFGAFVSLAVLVTASLALTAWTAFLAIRRHVHDPIAAGIGGLVVGFSPYMAGQALDHANLIALPLVPVLLMALEDIAITPRGPATRAGVRLGVVAGLQMYISEEVLLTAILTTAVLLVTLAALRPTDVRERLARSVHGIGVAAAVGFTIAAPILSVQLLGAHRVRHQPADPASVSSDLLGFVVPDPHEQLVATHATGSVTKAFLPGSPIEHGEYVGPVLLLLLVLTCLALRRSLVARSAGICALAIALLSLGPVLHVRGHDTGVWLPERLLTSVPGYAEVLPARLTAFMWIAIGFVIAVLATHVRRLRDRRRITAAAVIGAALVTIAPVAPFPAAAVSVPRFFTDGGVRDLRPGTVALVVPYPSPYAVATMTWQQRAGFRFAMPGGYWLWPDHDGATRNVVQGDSTTAQTLLDVMAGRPVTVTDALLATIRDECTRWGVQVVLLGPMANREAAAALLTGLFGPSDSGDDDVTEWQVPGS